MNDYGPYDPLTDREQEVLGLIAAGLSNAEIAKDLVLSVGTVKWYAREIYSKLGVGSRTQAVARAAELNLLASFADSSGTTVSLTHNLPAPPTSLVGRRAEMAKLKQLLQTNRIITITGPGGSGKTRLALQVAADLLATYEHGVYFVALASVSDPSHLSSSIAHTLGLSEDGPRSPLDTLKFALQEKQTLLVLDNFEHLISSAQLIVALLHSAPGLKVLVTSREPLHLYGEHEFPVPPLTLPDLDELPSLEDLARYSSVALFVARARAVKPDFVLSDENARAVAELCARLDGLPLAIELAAARTKIFSPNAMLTRLDSRFRWLTTNTSDLPIRHQALRNTIDWSYNLLEEGERRLFEQLSVFAVGSSMDAVEEVCNADRDPSFNVLEALAALVDKNLLRQEELLKGESRFMMLETIREYARERLLASDQIGIVRQSHFEYFLKLAEVAEPQLRGPQVAYWLRRLEVEHSNLRAALQYALEHGTGDAALQLVAALGWFWSFRGYLLEGIEWMDRVLVHSRNAAPATRTKALLAAEYLAQKRGDYDRKKRYANEHLKLARSVGDTRGIAWALHSLGDVARDLEGDYGQAAELLQESVDLFRKLGEMKGTAAALNCLGEVARCQENYREARLFYEESRALEEQLGDNGRITIVTLNLGSVALHQGNFHEATAHYKKGMALSQELENRGLLVLSLAGWAGLAYRKGHSQRAARLLGAAAFINETIGAHLDAADRIEWDRSITTIREELDEATFAMAWAEGQAMTMEQVISYVLDA